MRRGVLTFVSYALKKHHRRHSCIICSSLYSCRHPNERGFVSAGCAKLEAPTATSPPFLFDPTFEVRVALSPPLVFRWFPLAPLPVPFAFPSFSLGSWPGLVLSSRCFLSPGYLCVAFLSTSSSVRFIYLCHRCRPPLPMRRVRMATVVEVERSEEPVVKEGDAKRTQQQYHQDSISSPCPAPAGKDGSVCVCVCLCFFSSYLASTELSG